jgi:hypothetical protein
VRAAKQIVLKINSPAIAPTSIGAAVKAGWSILIAARPQQQANQRAAPGQP